MSYSEFLGYLLSVSFRMLKKKIESVLAPYNLTAPQWGVLSRLYENDGLTLVEIAERLYSDASTIKLIIDKLEKKGLVKRVLNENDKRSLRIFLTEDAKLLEQPLKTLVLKVLNECLKNFSSEEEENFKKLLKKLIKNLSGEGKMTLIKDYKLELFPPPCLPGSVYWSARLEVNSNIEKLLPYLNGYLEKRIYNPQAKTIVFNFENHKVSVRPNEIKISNIPDKESGEEIAKKVVQFLNEIWQKKDEITPDFEKKEPPKVVDIYKLLPKTNCKKCNQPNCFVFATKLAQGEVEIYECPELTEENKEKIEKLFWG